jgi:hypothetical protein
VPALTHSHAQATGRRLDRVAASRPSQGLARHVLGLQRSIGNQATVRLLQRSELTSGPNAALRLRVGSDVGLPLAAVGWTVTQTGPLDDAAIATLRQVALGVDDSIDDNERLFIAALIDPADAGRLHADHPWGVTPGDTLEFSAASITPANRARVRDFGRRTVPATVKRGSGDAALKAAIVATAGSFAAAAQNAIAIADAAKVPYSDVFGAMLNGASDSTDGDRAFAAAVYAIARREHLDVAADILAGKLKVDEVPSSALPKNAGAEYQPEAGGGGNKGDTLYLPSDLKFGTLPGQATVVHELAHAAQDKSTAAPRTPSVLEAEEEAYRAEADFLLWAVATKSGAARTAAVNELVPALRPQTLLLMVLAATEVLENDRALAALKDIYAEVGWTGHPDTRKALKGYEFRDLLARAADEDRHYEAMQELEARIARAIAADYKGIQPATDAGLRGESRLDGR